MKRVRLTVPPLPFTILGVLLVGFGIREIIRLNVGGPIESVAWFVVGVLFCCVLMQVLMHIVPEHFCKEKGRMGE